ncbi:MAG: hypothetical protein MUO58_20055 [Anaerolineales bacterium]|nr:hypothetical protein [Anaerolineales bacterium]
MTVDQTILLMTIIFGLGVLVAVWVGWVQIQAARKLPYYLLRKERTLIGWRWFALAAMFGIASIVSASLGQTAVYALYPPTPSITPTATKTSTPTVTPTLKNTTTPTITLTSTITPTATQTPTPSLPEEIHLLLLRETQVPDPEAVFSLVLVARRIDSQNRPIGASDIFTNPVERLFGTFTYNYLTNGLRWTAIWYSGSEMLCLETHAWDGGTGGYGYTECEPGVWLPGEYEIQIFLSDTWMVSTRFAIEGDPPTPTMTPSSTTQP